jgi:hypothetical protein
MRQSTRDVLKIFWQGEERSGVLCYAYCATGGEPALPLNLWPRGTQAKATDLRGPGWRVRMWDVLVEEWPGDLVDVLRRTLVTIVESGASAAWCGLEGVFVDPPALFKPEFMTADGVYAAYTREMGFVSHLVLEGIYAGLSTGELEALREQIE